MEEQSKGDSKDPDLSKGKEAKNGTDNAPPIVPPKENSPPVMEGKIDASPPPPKVNDPSPPPVKEENKEDQDTEKKETPAEPVKGTPVDPVDQSGKHQDTHDSKYNVCEEGKNLVTLLQTSGDGKFCGLPRRPSLVV